MRILAPDDRLFFFPRNKPSDLFCKKPANLPVYTTPPLSTRQNIPGIGTFICVGNTANNNFPFFDFFKINWLPSKRGVRRVNPMDFFDIDRGEACLGEINENISRQITVAAIDYTPPGMLVR